MSAPLITEYDGLRFIFDFYPMPPGEEVKMLDPHNKTDPAMLFQSHFARISAQMGYPLKPPENLVNLMANTFVDYHLPEGAYRLYALNLFNYPQSKSAWQNMGEYFTATGDTLRARGCYERAKK